MEYKRYKWVSVIFECLCPFRIEGCTIWTYTVLSSLKHDLFIVLHVGNRTESKYSSFVFQSIDKSTFSPRLPNLVSQTLKVLSNV